MKGLATLALVAFATASAARAQEPYPSRPVSIVVGFPPGTATDTVARPLAESLTQSMGGARFVVENRTGQGGSIAAASVARAAPDGYTIFVAASAPLVINPHVYPNLRYDSRTDFAPIGQFLQLPFVLVTGRDARHRAMRDVVEAAKRPAGAVSYSTPGNGTTSHLIMSMLMHGTGAKLNHVPYRGTAQSLTDVVAGRVDVTFETVVGSLPFIRDGLLRPLAVTAEQRSSLLPDVPTTGEAGFPDARGSAWLAMFGPAGTPPAIVAKLNDAMRTALRDEAMVATLRALGAEPDPTSPEEMGATVRRDHDRWGEIVRVTGARAD